METEEAWQIACTEQFLSSSLDYNRTSVNNIGQSGAPWHTLF